MTLVDASHTPDQPIPESRVSEAGSAKIPVRIPLRARISLYRQRVILTIRWWFRLPIDDAREAQIEARFDALITLNRQQMETIQTLTRISNNQQQRLQYYEAHIPRMRELKREFDREQERQAIEANGGVSRADMGNGMIPKRPLILSS